MVGAGYICQSLTSVVFKDRRKVCACRQSEICVQRLSPFFGQRPTMEFPAFTLFTQRPLFGVTLLSTLVVIVVWQVNRHVQARRYKFPPRIPGIPIFGNTFQLPPIKQGVWAMEMAKQYGEMYGKLLFQLRRLPRSRDAKIDIGVSGSPAASAARRGCFSTHRARSMI